MGYLAVLKRRSLLLLILLFLAVVFSSSAHAAAVIELDKRLTWDLVGLDSNDVLSGPNTFPVGYRYCNTGDTPATNVVGTFSWGSANSYIDLETGTSATISLDELGAGVCHDFYFNIEIARNDFARGTDRGYHIAVTADGISPVETPSYNQIFVESLISQNRNQTDSIEGPATVYLGETYQYILHGSTATNGYEQLEAYITFPNNMFRIIAVDARYSAPPGINDAVYADACDWVHDPDDPDYNTCLGSDKIGGGIFFTYDVEIIGTGSTTMSAMIYDMSGSSYHYNKDYGTETISVTALPELDPALSMEKIITAGNPYTAVADTIDYSYLISNIGNVALAGPVTVADDKTTVTCPAVTTVGNHDSNLNIDESIICTASYSVVQEDLDSCSVTNVASATADGITSLTDTESATCITGAPALSIDKIITSGNPFTAVGGIIDYSYLVTNTGNASLAGPVTVDDDRTTVTCPAITTLDSGESIICTADYTVVQADLDSCSVINVARASAGVAPVITSLDDIETARCSTIPPGLNPALSIEKIITAGNLYTAVGDIIDYSYLVTNIGNVLLEGPVTVADDKNSVTCPAVTAVGNHDSNLNTDESIICTGSYTVVQEDLDSCRVTNVASASAAGITSPTDTETAMCSEKFPWFLFIPSILPPPCPDEPLYCYIVSDRDNETAEYEGSKNSALLKYTFRDEKLELIGRLGVGSVEAMTLSLDGTTLYAVDSHRFGIIDTTPGSTSSFSPVSSHYLGTGDGALGKIAFRDVDGISFDPSTGTLYGTNRLASSDLLLQINPATGTFVENAFGQGIDYVVIGSNAEAAAWFDLDDIGIDEDGTMYGIANAQGQNDRLVLIDKETGNISNPLLLTVEGGALNDVEGFSYYGRDTFYGTTGVETIEDQEKLKNSFFKIEMNPVRVEKITSLDQSFDGYKPYDFEALACRMCVRGN